MHEQADEPHEATEEPAGRRWSASSLAVLGCAAVVLISAVGWHLGTVFLSIAPSNTVSQRYRTTIDQHVLPEFEQNWQLFAPNPLQLNIDVQARVQVIGTGVPVPRTDSGWIDLTAQDIAAIRGNPFPSHADQNLLRRAWDYYAGWHNQSDETSLGFGGPLSQEYLKRIALQRIGRTWHGQQIVQIQFRAVSRPVAGPSWTGAPANPSPTIRQLPWWVVDPSDYEGLGR